MKNKILFPIVILIALIGGAGLLHLSSNLTNQDETNNDVSTRLLEIENLNSTLNQLVLKSRLNIDANYDELARTTTNISNQLRYLSETHFRQDNIAGSLLEERFNAFKSALEIKVDHIESFKSHNSVLRNSDRYVPVVGKELVQISNEKGLADNAQLYENIIIDTLLFTKQNDTEKALDVAAYSEQIVNSESVMPIESTIKLIEFSNHVATIGESKKNTDGYMQRAIAADQNVDIQEIQGAWSQFQIENNKQRQALTYYSIIYVALMFGLISWLVVRLRNSYKSLDNEVKRKTDQVKSAYEDLRASEKRLAQSEKMASLGQLVAGVAHQVNTPLAFASSNVGLVKSKLSSLLPIFDSAKKIGDAVLNKEYDNNTIRSLLSQQVSAYSKAKTVKTDDLLGLLDDSSEGLHEIQQTVESLTNYSHVDSSLFENVAIDSVIKRALKMCRSRFSNRKISCELSKHRLLVDGVATQLMQVMINILNNAFDATDDEKGIIAIKAFTDEDGFAEITVSDNGHGIDEAVIGQVLDPFFTTKDIGEGTGLGLSICNQIVTAHKGEISIESDGVMGTVIKIKIPLANLETEATHDQMNNDDTYVPA